MNDIVISSRRIAREAQIFAGCILAAFIVNAICILYFRTAWRELVTTLRITLAVALVFFALVAVLRAIVYCAGRLLRRKAG